MGDRNALRSAAALVAAALVVVGILGFVPGVTTHHGELRFAGHASRAKLFGVFQTSVLQNLLHLAYGIVLVLSKTVERARTYLLVGGIAFLAVWVVGVMGALEWLPVNPADNWLHFVLGAGMLGAGSVASRESC
jgi:uncharacterized protein DUF4383